MDSLPPAYWVLEYIPDYDIGSERLADVLREIFNMQYEFCMRVSPKAMIWPPNVLRYAGERLRQFPSLGSEAAFRGDWDPKAHHCSVLGLVLLE